MICSYHCGAADRIIGNGSVQPRERISRKVVNRKVLALILNFSTVGHGGAYGGGVWIILAYEPEGSTSILWKRHIFKAVGGAIKGGGRLLGCFNGIRIMNTPSVFILRKRGS